MAFFLLLSCAEPNSPVESVLLIGGETFTRANTVADQSITLEFDAEEGKLIRFRGWSVGLLAGVAVEVLDPNGEVIFEGEGVGTEYRIDALPIRTTGRHSIAVQWMFGQGVAGYRFEVIGNDSERISIQPRLSLDSPVAGHIAVVLPDGRVLIAGGHTTGSGMQSGRLAPVATTLIFDPLSGQATPGQQMLDARAYHAAAVFPGGPFAGQVLLAGGLGESGDALLTTEIFDPATGVFRRGPDLPEPRAYLQALPIQVPPDSEPLFLDGNIVLAFGERTRRGPQHSFSEGLYSEIDENRREIWRTDGDIVQRISNGDSAALLESGRLFGQMVFQPLSRSIMFIGGGIDTIPTSPGCSQTSENICHCTSQDIPLCTEFRDCQEGQCATVISYPRKDLATNLIEVHRDGQRFTLPPSGRLNRARAAFGVAQLSGDRVLVAGGASAVRRNFWPSESALLEAADTIDSVEMWTPDDPADGTGGTWRVLAPLSIPREHFSLVSLSDGGIYAVGGQTPVPGALRAVNLVERFDAGLLRFTPVGNMTAGRAATRVVLTDNERQVWAFGGESRDEPAATVETITVLGTESLP